MQVRYQMPFDREREDASNIIALEHINLQQPDQQLAALFYVAGLQFTRDPYLMVGVDNMWINIGRTQMHLPTHPSAGQQLRGTIGITVPDIDLLERSLCKVQPALAGTRFDFHRSADTISVNCPWGNRFHCHPPDPERWGSTQLGIVYVEFDVASASARPVADFYTRMLGAPTHLEPNVHGLETAVVRVGADQQLRFAETRESIAAYDGHHIQVYVADFSGPYRRLKERNLVSKETNAHEWRFIDIIDVDTGETVYQLEHEVRSLRHPLCGRPLVNRNPEQSNAAYSKGHDAFRGMY